PVLPMIPFSTNPDVGNNTDYYNAIVTKLYDEYGEKLVHGPDFDKFFKENTWALSSDGVHPNSEGYEAMKKLWAETMYENVYKKISSLPPVTDVIKGDINDDGEFNIADIVTMQKWLIGDKNAELKSWKAGDLCDDGIIDSFDLAKMKKLIIKK
ncbi:MAG: lysophospholipase, partial [Ruminococcus sp.]|nr:lysophospholipase [Ruminococcus sp.]